MSGFHEVRFPDNIAYGATGGPEFATTVVATGSGHEKRNVNWAEARGRWDVASGLKKQAQIDELIAFFRARRGKAYGFRFKDWTDYKATGQLLGTGDAVETQFQLVKHYPSGSVIEVRTHHHQAGRRNGGAYLEGVEQLSGQVRRHDDRARDLQRTSGRRRRSPPTSSSTCRCASTPTIHGGDHRDLPVAAWQQIPIVELFPGPGKLVLSHPLQLSAILMPKLITPAMQAHLGRKTTRLAAIWRITRKDGQQFFFTDHDRDIVFGGDTTGRMPASSVQRLRSDAGFAVDNLDWSGCSPRRYRGGRGARRPVRGGRDRDLVRELAGPRWPRRD
jgi:hypothetical protein